MEDREGRDGESTRTGRIVARIGRREFARGLVAASALTALATLPGCAPRPTGGEPAALRVELPRTLPAKARNWLARALREEADGLGVRVDLTTGDPLEALRRATVPDSPAGSLPDLLLTTTAGPARLGFGLGLADASDTAERLVRKNGAITTRLRQTLTSEKHLWAAPFGATSRVWLLRRDLADERGVGAVGTYTEALEAAAKLADPGRGVAGWALPLSRAAETESLIAQAIVGYGGALATAGGQRPTLASGAAAEALSFLAGLARRPDGRATLPVDRGAWSGEGIDTAFFAGRVALAPVSAVAYAAFRAEPRGLPTGVRLQVVTPPGGPKGRATSADGFAFVISRDARRPDLAGDLLDRLLTPTRLRELAVETGGAFVPAYADVTHDPFWDGDPVLAGIVQATRGDASRGLEVVEPGHPGPISAGAAEVAATLSLSAALARCVEDGASAEESLRQAQREGETVYDRVGRDLAAIRRRRSGQG